MSNTVGSTLGLEPREVEVSLEDPPSVPDGEESLSDPDVLAKPERLLGFAGVFGLGVPLPRPGARPRPRPLPLPPP